MSAPWAARQPALRAAAGPLCSGMRTPRTGSVDSASSPSTVPHVSSGERSSTSTTSKAGAPSWRSSASIRRGRSVARPCVATTTLTFGRFGPPSRVTMWPLHRYQDDRKGPIMAEAYVQQAGERRSARIESLRALAALGVLFGHAYGWSHNWQGVYATFRGRVLLSGGFGVFLFFALSGYLLFLPFARATFGSFERI